MALNISSGLTHKHTQAVLW